MKLVWEVNELEGVWRYLLIKDVPLSVCACVYYLVYFCGALCQDGANSRGQAQLHQALQMSLGICLHLVSRLFQGAAVYQSKTPAQAHINQHTLLHFRN